MHKRILAWLILLLVGGLLLPAVPALASNTPPDDGVIVWNEDYTLEEGEELDSDLIVFNGDVTLEVDSRVRGSVVVWGGDADVEGTIERELVVSDGNITLGDDAWVEGNVVCSWNCDIELGDARVEGSIIEGISARGLPLDHWRDVIRMPLLIPSSLMRVSGPRVALEWTFATLRSVTTILVIAAVAGLVALIWPHQTAQVGQAVIETPWPSFGIGLLTAAAAVALIVALAITICFSPASFLVTIALGVAGLFGWIGIGGLVGGRLMQALNVRESAPLWTVGLGTLVITLIGAGLSTFVCLAPFGWLMIVGLGCLGLGAVVLTRFGTTPFVYPSSPPSAPVEAPTTSNLPGEESENDETENV